MCDASSTRLNTNNCDPNFFVFRDDYKEFTHKFEFPLQAERDRVWLQEKQDFRFQCALQNDGEAKFAFVKILGYNSASEFILKFIITEKNPQLVDTSVCERDLARVFGAYAFLDRSRNIINKREGPNMKSATETPIDITNLKVLRENTSCTIAAQFIVIEPLPRSSYFSLELRLTFGYMGFTCPKFSIHEQNRKKAIQSTLRLSEKQAHDNLGHLLESGAGSDIVFKFKDGQEIAAHKLFLISHSDVFKTMFSTPMQENQAGAVKIEDFTSAEFRNFLRYMYTGQLPDESVGDLLALSRAAHKYGVSRLLDCTSTLLGELLPVEGVLDVLLHADVYGLQGLIGKCIDFMVSHSVEAPGDKLSALAVRNPDLAVQILQRLLKKP